MESRAHQAEAAEASLAADLRNVEAQCLSNEGLMAKCATLEERLSEMRAEQVCKGPAFPCMLELMLLGRRHAGKWRKYGMLSDQSVACNTEHM